MNDLIINMCDYILMILMTKITLVMSAIDFNDKH